MKNKIWFVGLPVLMLVISSCSMSSNEITIDFDDRLTFSWDTLTIDDVSNFDLMSFIVNDFDDYQLAVEMTLTEDEYPEGLWSLMDTLEVIGTSANQTLMQLYGLSSSELNDVAETYAITLTIDDIVVFNDFKSFTATQTLDVSIDKQAMIEARIDRSLTSQEVEGFAAIQSYLNSIHRNYPTIPYPLHTVTYDTFEAYLLAQSYTLTDEKKAAMEAAFSVFELIDQD